MRKTRDFDPLILLTSSLLALIGLALIYSVGVQAGITDDISKSYFNRQALWLGLGGIALLLGYAIPFRIYEALAYVGYVVCFLLLIVVMFVGGGQSAQRWLELGPIRLQPSEFSKIALLFLAARILSGYRGPAERTRRILILLGFAGAYFLLVLRQPDLGTAIILALMLMPMLYWRGVRGPQLFVIMSPLIAGLLILYGEEVTHNPWPFGVYIVLVFVIAYLRRERLLESIMLVTSNLGVGLILPAVWERLKVYQQQRILNFLDPEADKLGAGWQVFQSKIAIGSGGISGKGYLQGTQKALEFLPAKHTDFVFSVLGEEMGFVGALLVLTLFAILIGRALYVGVKCKSEFASAVCIGIASYFFFQVFINVAMTTGMAPVTGIPIPFMSYGGSSLVVSCFMVGFLLNCSVRWSEY